jgi:hypothetical protein
VCALRTDSDPLRRWQENPFFILGLAPEVSELEAERQGRKLLAQLELGVSSARIAHTPLGPVERSPDLVRRALAALRNPLERRVHALWARLPEQAPMPAQDSVNSADASVSAMEHIGWPGL